ncbi:alpha/beta fold hydrolase [Nonomuraea sp. B12E4]|uniref:alpha/beta fold hydrolase n=1 Tax=Nonomuraea sp. B12E4 TaxID=3153564 RepID=UPI00325E7C17
MRKVQTEALWIGYEQWGSEDAPLIVLMHGFPDGAGAWRAVADQLVPAGFRVVAPYLRGYGPTSFRDRDRPRSAQQAALARDLLDFLDAAGLVPVLVGGHDWGGSDRAGRRNPRGDHR